MHTCNIRFLLIGILSLFALISCKTPSKLSQESTVFDGSAPTANQAIVGESPDEQCNKFGGELVDGECICADGTAKKNIKDATHCSAWVKKKYPDCYSKGGRPKAFGGGDQLCVCPHGEELAKGAGTCYDMFKKRFPDCANKGGIVLADDSTCRCLHGASALKLSDTCETDFQKVEERCYAKRGVLEKGSACKCRDGSIVDSDEKSKCAEPWFFYKDQSVTTAAADTTTNTQPDATKKNENKKDETTKEDKKNVADAAATDSSTKKEATCTCEYYQNHCMIYKPGDKVAIKWLNTSADKCTRNLCYRNFSDIIFEKKVDKPGAGGCDGSWDYKAPLQGVVAAEKKEEAQVDIAKYCVCKKLRTTNPVGCGLFLPGNTQPNSYANTFGSCTPEDCVSIFGNSYTIKTHCYDSPTKKFLWRHQD